MNRRALEKNNDAFQRRKEEMRGFLRLNVMRYERLSQKELSEDPKKQLINFKKTKDFLVAIDTDGCVSDNMNGKQMLIFHPHFMEFYNLWPIESYFREVAEYYNLFSVHRGCNRFIAIQLVLKSLQERIDVQERLSLLKVELPDVTLVESFIEYTKRNSLGLGNPSLEKFIDNENPTHLGLYKLLGWSEAVNRTFPHISAKIPPFDDVERCLKLMSQHANIIIVSQTPYTDLADYWEKYGLVEYVALIAGQEMGTKAEHIQMAKEVGSYREDHILMIGDAMGDLKAIKANGGFFYPIVPGKETESWKTFYENFSDFLSGRYNEKRLLLEFEKALPSIPPWKEEHYSHIDSYRKHQNIRMELYRRFNPNGRFLVI